MAEKQMETQWTAMVEINNPALLAQAVMAESDPWARIDMVWLVTDHAVLRHIAKTDPFPDIRQAAKWQGMELPGWVPEKESVGQRVITFLREFFSEEEK